MVKKVVSVLLILALMLSFAPVGFAEDIIEEITGNTVNEENCYTVPFVPFDGEKEERISLMGDTDAICVVDVRVNEVYYSEEYFYVNVGIENPKDSRSNLKLSVVNSSGELIATQTEAIYLEASPNYSYLLYTMKNLSEFSKDDYYMLKFNYEGRNDIVYNFTSADVYPEGSVSVKKIELLDYFDNIVKLHLRNGTPGTKYVVTYNGGDKTYDVTVLPDSTVIVNFEEEFFRYASIRFYYQENLYYELFQGYLGDYSFEKDSYAEGVSMPKVIEANATSFYASLYSKGFGDYDNFYTEADVANVDMYLYDTVTGEIVATTYKKNAYNNGIIFGMGISVNLRINKPLNSEHTYIGVCDDGYTLRITEPVRVSDKPDILYVDCYDANGNWIDGLPTGKSSFRVYVDCINIADAKNIKLELLDESGANCITTVWDANNWEFIATTTKEITKGQYVLKASYGTVTSTTQVWAFDDAVTERFYYGVWESLRYDGKLYLPVFVESKDFDHTKYTYKVKDAYEDTYYDVKFHRVIQETSYNFVNAFVIEDCSDMHPGQYVFEIYKDGELVTPSGGGGGSQMGYFYINSEIESPFLYAESIKKTATGIEIMGEGLSDTVNYTVIGKDDETGEIKTIKASKNPGEQSLVVTNSELNKIVKKSTFTTGYNSYDDGRNFFIEGNNEPLGYFDSYRAVNLQFDSEFGFLRYFTNSSYEVLYLPTDEYSYYKIADTEEELATKSYEAITKGVLYELEENGEVIRVYAQFKDASGNESEIVQASIMYDGTAPQLEFNVEPPKEISVGRYGDVSFNIEFTSSEFGNLYYYLADKNGEIVDGTYGKAFDNGYNSMNIYFYGNDEDLKHVKKLVMYAMDSIGNRTQLYEYDISFAFEYSTIENDDYRIILENSTGLIVELYTYDYKDYDIAIPTEINGVKVKGIESYAIRFYGNGYELRLRIPSSVTEISQYAFSEVYTQNVTIVTPENSKAHEIALNNGYQVEIVTYMLGDIFVDNKVNTKDSIKLSQYLANWGFELTDEEKKAADVYADNKVNTKDSIKLSQFLAGWFTSLE